MVYFHQASTKASFRPETVMLKRPTFRKPLEQLNERETEARLQTLSRFMMGPLTQALIDAGRGHERSSETRKLDDPLALLFREIEDELSAIRQHRDALAQEKARKRLYRR